MTLAASRVRASIDALACLAMPGSDRLRTTVTIPADVVEAVRAYQARHPGAKFQEALLEMARLGAAEEERRAGVRKLAAERRNAVASRRRSGPAPALPGAEDARAAILSARHE
jgi:hypothetical protein